MILDYIHQQITIHKVLESVDREEYLDSMTFKENRRPLFTEIFGPLIGLAEEWRMQGATPEEIDFSAFHYRTAYEARLPIITGWLGGCEEKILEETAEHIIALDRMGRRLMLPKGIATLPLPLDFPVKTMDDWRKIKSHYAFSEERFGEGWQEIAKKAIDAGYVVRVSIPGGFDEVRQLMGEERACLACYEQPELVHDILDTIGATAERVLDRVSKSVQVDCLHVHEDMAGKSGPLWGPAQVSEFIKPYYRRIWDMLSARRARLFAQDSDGNMNSVIPAFLDAGVNLMYPIEPNSHMDMVAIRRQYGSRLAFIGGLDKFTLLDSPEKIAAELEYKIPPMVRSGGCVLGLDHRIPNGVPLSNYRFYIEKVWEIIERES